MQRFSVSGPVGRISGLRRVEYAAGDLPVVFVHGINGTATQWLPVADHVADREIVAVDLRGHGDSQPGGSYGAVDYAADVDAVMSALNIARAHLVGSSFGGAVCVTLAANMPESVASLTIIGGALNVAGNADPDDAIATLRRIGLEPFLAQIAAVSFGPGADDSAIRELVRLAAHRDVAVVEQILRAALTADVSTAAAQTTAPARVLTGAYDTTCPPALGAKLAAALHTGCTLLPDVGHMAHLEDPALVAAQLLDHIQSESHNDYRRIRGDYRAIRGS
ncbi:alpha/beta fold hydrolase [Mycobacterium vicinigordonae]|uniref:Alpha/beta fold hydrolase n=1 Tax=Mycobacterium vicinigordonae TaxID=1719132 RepID=A0A7D6EBN6_9MYCO|nr:alpha/beta fold hydrolase [Mycobacterium vicinigordonae]QLL09225.1 alpha/beta fold hydrolase [Mycobacterium vicinigordonae]